MKTQTIADLEVEVLTEPEVKALVTMLQNEDLRRVAQIRRVHPRIGNNDLQDFYIAAQLFEESNEQLPLQVQLYQASGLQTGLQMMREADPSYYELPHVLAKITKAVGMEVKKHQVLQKKEDITKEGVELTILYFQQARRHAQEALSLYQQFSRGKPAWSKCYETTISSLIPSSLAQEVLTKTMLQPESDRTIENAPELMDIIQNAGQAHKEYQLLFSEGVFFNREQSMQVLVNYANSLLFGTQTDRHRARGYFIAAQKELGNLPTIMEGFKALNETLPYLS